MPAQRRWHEQDLVLKDFSGGENQMDSPLTLQPNELSATKNVVGTKRGAIKRRKGVAKYNATAVPSSISGMTAFYGSVDGDVVIASAGGKVYDVPTTGASTDLCASTFTVSSNVTRFAQFRTRLYGVPSYASPFVVAENPDGSNDLLAWKAGVTVPTKTGTLAETDDGGLLDLLAEYKYKISYFYGEDGAHGESNPATEVTHTLTGTNETITITLWAADANHQYDDWAEANANGVDKVRIYRTEGGGSEFFFLADVTSGLTYVDKIADSALDDTTLPQSDNYTLPTYAWYPVVTGTRLVLVRCGESGESTIDYRVRWSMAGYPDIFPADNYTDLSGEHGEIRGAAVLSGQLFVFQESAISRLSLFGGSDSSLEVVTAVAGSWGDRSLAVCEEHGRDVAMFVACDGQIYSFDGTVAHPISMEQQDRIDTAIALSGVYTVNGAWDGRNYHLWMSNVSSPTTTCLRYDTQLRKQLPYVSYDTGTWWYQEYPDALVGGRPHRVDGGTDGGGIRVRSSTTIYDIDSGDDDDGTDISYHFYTGYLDCGDAGLEKRLGGMFIDSESGTALTTSYDTDWDTATGSFTTTTSSTPVRSSYDPANAPDFRLIRLCVTGSDGDPPSTVYDIVLRLGAARPFRKSD